MSLVVTSLQDFYVYKHSFVFPRDTTFNVTHSFFEFESSK